MGRFKGEFEDALRIASFSGLPHSRRDSGKELGGTRDDENSDSNGDRTTDDLYGCRAIDGVLYSGGGPTIRSMVGAGESGFDRELNVR